MISGDVSCGQLTFLHQACCSCYAVDQCLHLIVPLGGILCPTIDPHRSQSRAPFLTTCVNAV